MTRPSLAVTQVSPPRNPSMWYSYTCCAILLAKCCSQDLSGNRALIATTLHASMHQQTQDRHRIGLIYPGLQCTQLQYTTTKCYCVIHGINGSVPRRYAQFRSRPAMTPHCHGHSYSNGASTMPSVTFGLTFLCNSFSAGHKAPYTVI